MLLISRLIEKESEKEFIARFLFRRRFLEIDFLIYRYFVSALDWPQGWVSDMSNSPIRFNPKVEQKNLFDESDRVLAFVRRSNSIREIVRNLRLDKIR
jgi:hypothetical protein